MKEKLAQVLDKSLKANGVQLTGKELQAVVSDLVAFLEPAPAVAPPSVELKPIPVTV